MVYNKLYYQVIFRISLIVLTSFILVLLFYNGRDIVIMANVAVLLVIQVWLIIHFLNRTNNDLANFFAAISNDDNTLLFKRISPAKSYETLYTSLDSVNEKIAAIKTERYYQFQFFKAVTDHINTGLIAFDTNGNIELLNRAAQKLLGINKMTNLATLAKIREKFPEDLMKMGPDESTTYSVFVGDEKKYLSVKASHYRFLEKDIRLVSLLDIKTELEEKELESWQKLIRVLTHEIMNSIGPISSSIKTIKEFLMDEKNNTAKTIEKIDQELIEDTVKGLHIIEERSDGLVGFVNKFRSLTLVPKPELRQVNVIDLFDGVKMLLNKDLKSHQVTISQSVLPNNLTVMADKSLIEQILINLIKNSVQSLKEIADKQIALKAFSLNNSKKVIQVSDNGKGILPEDIEKVFIPFYTTKKDGSGIGLSISRQIMRLHKGYINVHSIPGKETVFTLMF